MNKNYYCQMNVGKIKYLVNFHNGFRTHKDDSPFYDVKTFKNKKKMEVFLKVLDKEGYNQR